MSSQKKCEKKTFVSFLMIEICLKYHYPVGRQTKRHVASHDFKTACKVRAGVYGARGMPPALAAWYHDRYKEAAGRAAGDCP